MLINNLQNYYKLDESSGNASDSVGSLTLSNTSVTYAAGKINNGAVFNGSALLTSASNIGITGSSARSVNCWIKYSSTVGDGLVAFGTTGTGLGFTLLLVSNQLYFGGESADVSGTGAALNDGLWHMVTVTYDGTTVRLYTDGVAGNTGTPTLNTAASHLFIGERNDGSNKFTGSIDEVGIWTRALSAGDVTTLYNSGAGQPFDLFQYKLVCTVGAFALTGIAAILSKGLAYSISTTVGQFVLTGINAVFTWRPSLWTNSTKHSTTFTNGTKHSSTFTNSNKSAVSWTNQSKS